jgi:hypothetical protein
MHLSKQDNLYNIPQKLPLPKIFNLLTDLKETWPRTTSGLQTKC